LGTLRFAQPTGRQLPIFGSGSSGLGITMDKPPVQTELRILMLEDVATDAELAEIALREAGLSFTARRVDTRETFIRALEEFKPDIVLADYNLPAFDGGSAVKIVRQQYPDIPVVMVSGAIGDEKAIELLRLGARDYVLKDQLARLGPAVRRTLSEEQGISARKAAEQALRQSEADIRALVEHSPVAMLVDAGVGADEKVVMMNRQFTELFGYTTEDVPDVFHWWPLAYPDEVYRNKLMEDWTGRVERLIQSHGDIEPMEVTVTCKDGSSRYVRISLSSIGSRNIITFEDLTERKRAEEKIRESEGKFHAIFDGALDGIVLADIETRRFAIGNPAICRMLGYSPEEITRLGVADIHPQQELPHSFEMFEKLARGEIQLAEDIPVKRKDGSVFYADITGSYVNFGGKNYLVGIFRDISERKQAKVRIQKLTRLYATLSQTNETIVRAANREELFDSICKAAVTHGKFALAWVGLVEEATRMVRPVCRYGAEENCLTNISISTDDVPEGCGPTGTAIRENRVFYVNDFASGERALPCCEAVMKCGFLGAVGLPLRFGNKVIGALTMYTYEPDFFDAEQMSLLEEMATDIGFALDNFAREAERKAAELRLLERELQYRTLADSGQALIWTSGTDKLCDYFNQPWLKFTGRTLEQELGNGWAEGVYPDDFSQCLAIYVAAFDLREPFSMAYRLRRHDGEYRWIQDDGCPRYNAEGEFIGYIGYCLDITGRKVSENKLEKSERHFRAVTESANDAIITAAGAGGIAGWNAAAERLFGYSSIEIIGQPLTVLMPERFRNLHSEGLARVMAGGAPHVIGKTVELAGLRKDGSEFPLELSLAQWQAADGRFFTAMIRDITGRKQAETQLAGQLDELRRWHETTLGREMRTLELKHEVNELLVKAGQPVRYPSAEP
jgi:PAS domain S-box-containing protein